MKDGSCFNKILTFIFNLNLRMSMKLNIFWIVLFLLFLCSWNIYVHYKLYLQYQQKIKMHFSNTVCKLNHIFLYQSCFCENEISSIFRSFIPQQVCLHDLKTLQLNNYENIKSNLREIIKYKFSRIQFSKWCLNFSFIFILNKNYCK